MDAADLDLLLARAAQNDPQALANLVDRYSRRVFGLLLRLTGDRDAAEDLLQETFLRVVRMIGEYEHVGRFEAWLFRIAANLARDRARKHGRRGPTASLDDCPTTPGPLVSDGPASDPSRELEQTEAGARLTTALEQLNDAEREIILLRYYSDLSFREIAELLEIPLGTALARAHRALKRLRDDLGAAAEE